MGCGPAGLSAGLYIVRANLSTLIIGKNDGNLTKAKIENYFGLKEKTDGATLVADTIDNLVRLGAVFCDDYVVKIEPQKDFVKAETVTGKVFCAKKLIIAIGKKVVNNKYKGGVSYCATCDGFFYRKKIVAVKGNNARAKEDIDYLKNMCAKVYSLTDGEKPVFETDVEVITEKISDIIYNDNMISGIRFGEKILSVDGLFISENVSVDSMQSFGIIAKDGFVKVNENYQTNIPDIYAVGDIVGMPYQVAKAVYDGMMCANHIIREHLKQK